MTNPTTNPIDFAAERCGHNFLPEQCPHDHCGYREALVELESTRYLLDVYCDAPLKAEVRACKIAEQAAEIERLRSNADMLDWLEAYLKSGGWSRVLIKGGVVCACNEYYTNDSEPWYTSPSIRYAIHLAMKGGAT